MLRCVRRAGHNSMKECIGSLATSFGRGTFMRQARFGYTVETIMPAVMKSFSCFIMFAGLWLGLSASPLRGEDKAIERRAAWTTSRLNGSPVPPEPYCLVRAFPQIRFEKPT